MVRAWRRGDWTSYKKGELRIVFGGFESGTLPRATTFNGPANESQGAAECMQTSASANLICLSLAWTHMSLVCCSMAMS